MLSSILHLCACIEGNSAQRRQLYEACGSCQNWDTLLPEVEKHGMGPLLYKHLETVDIEIPVAFSRGLKFLSLRHRHANSVRMKSLQQILLLLEELGVPSLVLKGGALCQTLYPEIGQRPMRDLDLWFLSEDVYHVHSLLQKHGFKASTAAIPDGYYHLPPLFCTVDGLLVCVELHHGLFPNDPPYYQPLSFSDLYRDGQLFEVDGVNAFTLPDVEMLWHLFQHGFHAPLTYEPFKLISVADIVSLVEKRVDTLDWHRVKEVYPQLFRSLSLFHYLTPWSERVLREIAYVEKRVPGGIGCSFDGWPRVNLSQKNDTSFWGLVCCTLFPAQWWTMLYYSSDNLTSYLWSSLVGHPLHLLRWMKVYWRREKCKKANPV
ncbi:MAG: nucleotidyltransferase family protein [Desulfobulbaceae bacterium]|nr:nucleotidyltransferase family protein [Desulfobulbaceae bacterium]